MINIETSLIGNIKEQLKLYLTELGEFAPFGCAIDCNNKLVPLGAYIEDFTNSSELISLLENIIAYKLNSSDYLIAAIAINIVVTENDEKFDAIELRIYEKDKKTKVERINYTIEKGIVHLE